MLELAYKLVVTIWKAYWFVCYSFGISLALYIGFYMIYLPPAEHLKTIHFQYRSDCDRKLGEQLCSFPKALLLLHDSMKTAKDGVRVLARGQKYDISLEIEMPLSEKNMHLGMFMSQIDLLNKEGKIVESSSRSSMLTHQNSLLSTIETVFLILPLLFGISEKKHCLVIPLIENFVDDSYNPAMSANLTLYAKDIQLYSARLRIKAIFTGIRYFMYNWPLTFSLLAFGNILVVVTLFFLWRKFRSTRTRSKSYADYNSDLSDTSEVELIDELSTYTEEESSTELKSGVLKARRRILRESEKSIVTKSKLFKS